MDVKFGTSGLRGLADDLLQGAAAAHAYAFARHLLSSGRVEAGAPVFVGRDRRESSPALQAEACRALAAAGLKPIPCGAVPTPALAGYAMERGAASLMITGSHIPADRNGLKFYRPDGEIDKSDEAAIATLANSENLPEGEVPKSADEDSAPVREWYRARYRSFAPADALSGKRIGVFAHSAVAPDLLAEILGALGAETVVLGRSDDFVPVDTEAVSAEMMASLKEWTVSESLDAIVSTDPDGDRPLLIDERGEQVRGDALGLISAIELGADAVVTPVTSNAGITDARGFTVTRTRVGSPYVLSGMAETEDRDCVIGFEANGGLMTASEIVHGGSRLSPLPTRDAMLPLLCALARAAAKGVPLSQLVEELALPVAAADRLTDYPGLISGRLIGWLSEEPANAAQFVDGLGTPSAVDAIDGVRIVLEDGATIHFRASGNAPEMRCYTQAAERGRADVLLREGLRRLNAFREQNG